MTLCARRGRAPALLLLAAALAACTPRPLLERAIAARGGAVEGLIVRVDADVYTGLPGAWQWTRALLLPDRYAWKVETSRDPDWYLFDGSTVRSFVGGAEVASDGSPRAPLRSHARFTAVANLDALAAPGVTLVPLAAADLPPGAREGLEARFADGAVYRLAFDERTLLIWAQGPLDLSPIGAGDATARFSQHRAAGGRLLPFAISYAFGDRRLAVESIRAACVNPPALTPASFLHPMALPDCR